MTEPAVKRRVLTKVRRQFIHKGPAEDEAHIQDYANLPATPEQLNENAVRLIEPSIGLVEGNRNIYAGFHFLNGNCKLNAVQVKYQTYSHAVTLDLKSSNTLTLPWGYYAERLESFGNLELATWAQRLRAFHENYPKRVADYLAVSNSTDPTIIAALAKEKARAASACKELESKYAYLKITVFGNEKTIIPLSLTYNEAFLKSIGHDVESFVDWTKENGIPSIFKGDSKLSLDISKLYFSTAPMDTSLFGEGPEYTAFICDTDGKKQQAKIQLYFWKDFGTDGFFSSVYFVRKDLQVDDQKERAAEIDEDFDCAKKHVRKKVSSDSESSLQDCDTDSTEFRSSA